MAEGEEQQTTTAQGGEGQQAQGEGEGQQQQQEGELLAGKYQDRSQLDQGITELASTLGTEVDPRQFTTQGAEQAYKALQRIQGKQGQQAGQGQQQQQAQPGQQNQQNQQGQGQQQGQGEESNELGIGQQGDEQQGGQQDDNRGVEEIVRDAGLDTQTLLQTFEQQGTLTDEQYQALRGQGWPKKAVDEILGAKAAEARFAQQQQQNIRQDAARMVGSEQQLDNLLQNAPNFVPQNEIDTLDSMLKDPNQYQIALSRIMEHHRQAVNAGNANPLIEGSSGGGGNQGAITSQDEYHRVNRAAIKGDPQAQQRLRQHVEAKKNGNAPHFA